MLENDTGQLLCIKQIKFFKSQQQSKLLCLLEVLLLWDSFSLYDEKYNKAH